MRLQRSALVHPYYKIVVGQFLTTAAGLNRKELEGRRIMIINEDGKDGGP